MTFSTSSAGQIGTTAETTFKILIQFCKFGNDHDLTFFDMFYDIAILTMIIGYFRHNEVLQSGEKYCFITNK